MPRRPQISHPPLPFPLEQFPEPFRSYPPARTRALPNCVGLPFPALALAAQTLAYRYGMSWARFPLSGTIPTPSLPAFPYPRELAQRRDGRFGRVGAEAHALVAAYWAFGWYQGVMAERGERALAWAGWFDLYARNGFQPWDYAAPAT